MKSRYLVGLVLVGALAQSAMAQNLVSNGDFATGDLTGWSASGDTSYALVGHYSVASIGAIGSTSGNAADLGTNTGELDLSQTLATQAGTTYLLQFAAVNDDNSGAADYLIPSVNGLALNAAALSDTSANQNWTLYSANFAATSASTSLQFAISNLPSNYELTNVSVTAVPEAQSWAMLLVGAAALSLAVRRQK